MSNSSDREARLEQALAEYLQAAEVGEAPEREAFPAPGQPRPPRRRLLARVSASFPDSRLALFPMQKRLNTRSSRPPVSPPPPIPPTSPSPSRTPSAKIPGGPSNSPSECARRTCSRQ